MKRITALSLLSLLALAILGACTSKRDNEGIAGLWEGVLEYPGFETRIVLKISVLPDGSIAASVLRPDESDDEIAASRAVFNDPDLRIEVASVTGAFDGQLERDSSEIDGEWRQGRWSQPVVLRRVAEVVQPARPQTPTGPHPYGEEEITFTNSAAQARLAGTLTLPREEIPCPVVILISGGGAHDRDYTILRHRPFLVLADYLTRRRIAVLRFDDRGVSASTGDRSQATTEDYADDVLAGVELLKGRTEINPRLIGLVGHSEGGTIASLAAAKSPDVSFIVMLGTPGLPGAEYNLQFEESTARALGQSEEAIASKRTLQQRVLAVVSHEEDPALARSKLRKIYQDITPPLPEDQIEAAIQRLLSPWFLFSAAYDPKETLRTITCPVLALFGELDVQVPPEGNLEAISQALASGGNTDVTVEVLPGLNHFFQTAQTGSPLEYGAIEETISPSVLQLITGWILEHTETIPEDAGCDSARRVETMSSD